jgi:hypothetical protein
VQEAASRWRRSFGAHPTRRPFSCGARKPREPSCDLDRAAVQQVRGLTLPQVLFKDPGWFFWAHTRPLHGDVAYEVAALYPKATRIRVPGTERLVVECVLDPRAGGLTAPWSPSSARGRYLRRAVRRVSLGDSPNIRRYSVENRPRW